MDERKDGVKEIDLRVLFNIIRKNIIPLILVTAIFGAAAFLGSSIFIPKKYEASAMLIVNNKKTDTDVVNSAEITAAQDLAEVYSIIIKSDTVLDQVIDDLKLDITYEQLYKLVSVSSVNSTQVISISVRHNDADFAKEVVADIINVAPPIITDKVEAGSVKVISEAGMSNSGNPVSPSLPKNTLFGAAIGFVFMLVIIFIKAFFRNSFKTEEDIASTLNIPLLGIIPMIDEKEFKR